MFVAQVCLDTEPAFGAQVTRNRGAQLAPRIDIVGSPERSGL
jgi:hypothetical protein